MSDLIDRQALRKAMYHEAMEKDSDEQKWDSGCWIRYKMFERVVDSMPSVQPERKKGEWIYDGKQGRFPACKCSVCSHYENADWTISGSANYCPNCGADMRGEENE